MWQGLIAIAAAKAAMTGYNLQPIVNKTHKYIKQLRGLGMLDTLSYAVKGGRLGKTISAIESLLNVKPLVTVKHGQVCLAGLARTRNKAIARLQLFLKTITHIDDLAIVHSTNMEEPLALADYACRLFPNISPRIARLGPAVGTHAGPRALVVVLKTNFQTEPCSNTKKSGA